MARVSVGQAAANAMAKWLGSQLGKDVTVRAKWPQASTRAKTKVVTIVPIGRRRRLDAISPTYIVARTNTTAVNATNPQARALLRLGFYMQAMQIDVWATSYDERDDLVDQLDDALSASPQQTVIGTSGQPIELDDFVWDGGTVLQLLPADGYVSQDGSLPPCVNMAFDEPEVDDDPDSVQRGEYRATYFGEARGEFFRWRTVPRLTQATVQLQSQEINPQGGASLSTSTRPVLAVAFAQSPVSLRNRDAFVEVDVSGGSVQLLMPANPNLTRPHYVKHVAGDPSANPIVVTAQGGIQIENPMQRGTFASSVNLTTPEATRAWQYDGLRFVLLP